MFLGEYQHSLDAKGRIILPSKFRARLAQGCVLTKGQDSCLSVYPPDEWERVTTQMRDMKLSNQQARNFARLLFSGAHEDSPDAQGRVLIPESLRRYAHLERDVTVIGAGHHAEVWDREAWEGHRSQKEREFSELAEENPGLPW